MGKLPASPAMIAGLAAQRRRKAEESPEMAAYQDQADERRSVRQAREQAQRAAFLKSPEGQDMLARRESMARAAAMLGKSDRWGEINTFTAMMRGMSVEKGVVKALAPNVFVQRLHSPANGQGGLLTIEHVAAAADYASLSDQLKVGGASRDPAEIRVEGGGAGCTELAVLNRMDAAKAFRAAQEALRLTSIVPEWGRVIRRLVDWVVLDGGHPLEDFDVKAVAPLLGQDAEKSCRALLFRQGVDCLCQHFAKSG